MLTWVKKNRLGKTAGVIGSLFRFAEKGPKEYVSSLNALMAYSALKPGEPTAKHIETLHKNLNARPVKTFEIPVSARVSDITPDEMTPFTFYSGCPSRRAPIFLGGSCGQSEKLDLEVEWFRGEGNRKFCLSHFSLYEPALRGLMTPAEREAARLFDLVRGKHLPGTDWVADWDLPTSPLCSWSHFLEGGCPPPEGYDDIVSAGKIAGLDKDGGWKIRWVANPHRIHQHVLEPLKNRLLSLCHRLPWDCTHDQLKAVPAIQNRMVQGGKVYSVDLSSATDFFPLSFQECVLRQLNDSHLWQQYIDLFVDLSRCQWRFGDSWVTWRKGQPMGLGPSFPSFALSHGFLLDHLAGHKRDLFYVLGDDVVILDDDLHTLYSRVLKSWEVPISESKSLQSERVAEFGGLVITPNYVFPMFKWKNIDDENFLEMMRLFGKRFLPMLTSRQRTVYEVVKTLQPPWGCAHEVTDRQRSEQDTLEFVERLREPESSTCWSFFQWFQFHKELPRSISQSLFHMRYLQGAFDKKVRAAIRRTHFPETNCLEGLRSYFAAVGVGTDLPSLHMVTKSRSLLELYEKILATSSKPSFQESGQFEQKFLFLLPDLIRALRKRLVSH
jgi:hypothetical protein